MTLNASNVAIADDAEKCLISTLYASLLQVGSLVVSLGISRDHISSPTLKPIFDELMLAWKAGEQLDAFSLMNRCRDRGLCKSTDESRAFMDLLHYAPCSKETAPMVAEKHIETLISLHAARRAFEIGSKLVGALTSPISDVAGILGTARAELENLKTEPEPETTGIKDCIMGAISDMEAAEDDTNAIEFGIGLDETAGPFLRGDLVLVAGPSGGGKSALAGNILENAASDGFKGVLFGLEMTKSQYAERMLASQGRVNIRDYKLSRRRMSDRSQITQQQKWQIEKIQRAAEKMRSWKVDVVTNAFTVNQCVAKMRQLKSRSGLDVAVIDYAQLMEGLRKDGDSRETEVASISRTLKRVAGELQIIIILLSQLNDEGRLRESRALGHDANTVLFVDGASGIIKVAKARSAPAGAEIQTKFIKEFTHFEYSAA